jgi:ketosteroid isomerase-like protein
MIMSLNVRCVCGHRSSSRLLPAAVIIAALAWLPLTSSAGRASAQSVAATDSIAVATVVERYHRALESGDSVGALALLTSDAVILESGGIETREEYRSHHLPADMAFARTVKSVRGPIHVVVRGDVAWSTSTSSAQGEFRGRPVNSADAELMVLTRTTDGWKINAIHWSSRSRRS